MKHKSTANSIAPLVIESERVIREAITAFKLQTKPEAICVTIQSAGRRNALGWFWGDSWKNGAKAKIHEINLCAEHLTHHNMGETLLHELAHAENRTLDITDCSGRLHNKRFKVMAERLGLIVKPRDKSVGFGFTDLGPEAEKFLARIKFDKAIFASFRCGQKSKVAPGSRLLKVECACGYVCRVTQKWLDVGAPICPECEIPMGVV